MIDAIGGTASFLGIQGYTNPDTGGIRGAAVGAAAQALGLTEQELATDLASGQSMADVASQTGVEESQVVSAVAGALQPYVASSGFDPSQIAQTVVDHRQVAGYRGGRGAASDRDGDGDVDGSSGTDVDGSQASAFAGLSALVGTSETGLLAGLETGTALPAVLGESGLGVASVPAVLGQQSTTGTLVDTTA